MTSLQLGLIAGGAALVVGVIVYNWLQMRRVRRRIEAVGGRAAGSRSSPAGAAAGPRTQDRVEPTLPRDGDDSRMAAASRRDASDPEDTSSPAAEAVGDDEWEPPIDVVAHDDARSVTNETGEVDEAEHADAAGIAAATGAALAAGARSGPGGRTTSQPDPDIECIVTLQPVEPVPAGVVAAGLHARLGKPLRWFGRRGADLPWQALKADTVGEFTQIAACLLLADRAGAASRPQIAAFVALVAQIAASLPAAFVAPEPAREVERAETLDRICADLDVQIGLTVLKDAPATIAGTRLRGVAEAAGFRLTDAGRFDCVQEDTGAVLYSLQNLRAEPLSTDTLRVAAIPGVVMLLDVARVAEPVRVFDQMKLAAKRMALTLDATLVDDNRRPLDDAALAAIRQQVQAATAALREVHIEPGSPRALALFGG
ncbi:MAG: cell division protein ZipA C-terminal FtsZ-binding domain-containing protein [Betaproteobacteria bacterium]